MSSASTEIAPYTVAERIAAVRSTATAWLSKVVLAVMDQGLISGSNFVMGILLARWLSAEQYGAYALAFSIFLLLSQFYISLLLEPMAVFGGSTYRYRQQGYLGALLWIHLGSALTVFFVLGISAGVAQTFHVGGNLPSALAAVTVAGPCVLLFWLVRRAFYLELSPAPAVLGAMFYCAVVLGGLFVVYQRGWLSVFSAFLLMAIGALLTSILSLLRLKPILRLRTASPGLRETWQQHWNYGRWALATSALLWIPSNIYFPVLSTFSGLARAGELKALINLTLPIANVATALSLLFQTYASRIHHTHGAGRLRIFAGKVTLLYAAGGMIYWILLVVFRQQVVHFLYGGNYQNLAPLVPWLAVASILQMSIAGPTIGLRAMEAPNSVFWAYLASSTVSVLVGFPFAWAFGVRGVVVSMMASSLVGLIGSYALLKRRSVRAAVPIA